MRELAVSTVDSSCAPASRAVTLALFDQGEAVVAEDQTVQMRQSAAGARATVFG